MEPDADYLYLGFTDATAFSPTDVMPLAPWAKIAMAVQSLVSLGILGLVTICASRSAPPREVSKLSKARKTTKPSSTAKPVARTPNTPAAR